jgi:hypothetical protein
VAISPLPIVAVVLMLVTPRGRVNGPGSYVVFVAIAAIGVKLIGNAISGFST